MNEKLLCQKVILQEQHIFISNSGIRKLRDRNSKESHSGPKMPKSKWRGAGPKFIYHVKGGHIRITKTIKFFKSVGRNFSEISEKIWAGFPRALPPGITDKNECIKF